MAKTRRYRVTAVLTVSVSTVVEARNATEAKEIAGERPVQGLCHQCSSGDSNSEWSLSGELDGEPQADTFDVEVSS